MSNFGFEPEGGASEEEIRRRFAAQGSGPYSMGGGSGTTDTSSARDFGPAMAQMDGPNVQPRQGSTAGTNRNPYILGPAPEMPDFGPEPVAPEPPNQWGRRGLIFKLLDRAEQGKYLDADAQYRKQVAERNSKLQQYAKQRQAWLDQGTMADRWTLEQQRMASAGKSELPDPSHGLMSPDPEIRARALEAIKAQAEAQSQKTNPNAWAVLNDPRADPRLKKLAEQSILHEYQQNPSFQFLQSTDPNNPGIFVGNTRSGQLGPAQPTAAGGPMPTSVTKPGAAGTNDKIPAAAAQRLGELKALNDELDQLAQMNAERLKKNPEGTGFFPQLAARASKAAEAFPYQHGMATNEDPYLGLMATVNRRMTGPLLKGVRRADLVQDFRAHLPKEGLTDLSNSQRIARAKDILGKLLADESAYMQPGAVIGNPNAGGGQAPAAAGGQPKLKPNWKYRINGQVVTTDAQGNVNAQ